MVRYGLKVVMSNCNVGGGYIISSHDRRSLDMTKRTIYDVTKVSNFFVKSRPIRELVPDFYTSLNVHKRFPFFHSRLVFGSSSSSSSKNDFSSHLAFDTSTDDSNVSMIS